MQKEKKVKIELPAIDGSKPDTPIKHVKHKENPLSNNFFFRPKFASSLGEHVESVKWDSINKTFVVVIKETHDFKTYRWLEYMKDKAVQAAKGPFNIDIDNDAIVLDFHDDEGTIFNRIEFKNITLAKHFCKLGKHLGSLKHKIVLKYDKSEMIDVEVVDFDPHSDQNKEADDEWQTVADA